MAQHQPVARLRAARMLFLWQYSAFILFRHDPHRDLAVAGGRWALAPHASACTLAFLLPRRTPWWVRLPFCRGSEKRSVRIYIYEGFSNREITILSMNKTQKCLKYWVQIYFGCSASITFYEWNLISVKWPPRARLQRSVLWTQFFTTLAHISTGTLAISRWMLSLRSSKVSGLFS